MTNEHAVEQALPAQAETHGWVLTENWASGHLQWICSACGLMFSINAVMQDDRKVWPPFSLPEHRSSPVLSASAS